MSNVVPLQPRPENGGGPYVYHVAFTVQLGNTPPTFGSVALPMRERISRPEHIAAIANHLANGFKPVDAQSGAAILARPQVVVISFQELA